MAVVSLLVTIITQMVSALLGLRGKNLADGLEAMIYKIDPKFDEQFTGLSKDLADAVLMRPAISDSILSMNKERTRFRGLFNAWKRAAAVRPDELFAALEHLADMKINAVDQNATAAALEAARAAESGGDEAGKLEKIASWFWEQITGKPINQARYNAAKEKQARKIKYGALKLLNALKGGAISTGPIIVDDALKSKAAAFAQLAELAMTDLAQAQTQAQAWLKQFEDAGSAALNNLESRFDSVQDRVQQWFAMHMRIITVISSILIAFILQLDALRLMTRIANDADLRGKLVSFSTNAIQRTADEVFSNTMSQAAINAEVFKQLKNSNDALVSNAVANVQAPTAVNLENRAAMETWLESNTNTSQKAVLDEFRKDVQMVTRANLDTAANQFENLTGAFSKTGFQLMPDPYPGFLSGQWSWPWSHLFGILTSAALLSLGAPFWFNQLKSLASLRSQLSEAIDADDENGKTDGKKSDGKNNPK